ncbi:MAG: hypothetical protein GY790_07220 [Bacteroidetes bacterium]|nr:hypothetical protein [Bacteroidota bacterium]
MKKLFRIILILGAVGILSAFSVYMYVFHKPHRNIAKEAPAYVMDAQSFYSEFSSDETSAYEKYGNQVVQVSGEVIDISMSDNSASLVLLDEMEGIACAFDSLGIVRQKGHLEGIQIGDNVNLKGQCDGYDMIMGVVLTRCILLEDNIIIASE